MFLSFSFPTLLTLLQIHPSISFKNIDRLSPTQRLTVPFDVPHVHVLHTVRMHPLHDHAMPFLQQGFLAMGSVLPLQVFISHTRRWWTGVARSSYDGIPLDFKYEVQALPDDWTIGGQKKGQFSTKVSHWSDSNPIVVHNIAGR